jgi:hypothetical protein
MAYTLGVQGIVQSKRATAFRHWTCVSLKERGLGFGP